MMLVLASTSPYRRGLLARLGLPFETARPDVDEIPLTGESPMARAQRLAEAKARAVAERHRDAWVIGSDQVAELNGSQEAVAVTDFAGFRLVGGGQAFHRVGDAAAGEDQAVVCGH